MPTSIASSSSSSTTVGTGRSSAPTSGAPWEIEMRIVTTFIALVLLVGAPFGTSLAQRGMVPPHVTVQSLEPLPAAGRGQRFRAVFRVDTLNTEPLKLRGIEFSLRLAHQGLLDGRLPAMTIEALDEQVVPHELSSELAAS